MTKWGSSWRAVEKKIRSVSDDWLSTEHCVCSAPVLAVLCSQNRRRAAAVVADVNG